MGNREFIQQSLLSRLLKFKDARYIRHQQGEVVYTARILQLIAIFVTFLSWIIVIFAQFNITKNGLNGFRVLILGYPDIR